MSRKHYIEVAEMLNDQRLRTRNQERDRVATIAMELALIFKRDNRQFNAGKFFDAAGFPDFTASRMGLN